MLANILGGIYFNVKTLGFNFDWNKLGTGVLKAIIIAVMLFLMVIPVTFIPGILDWAKIEIPEKVKETISIFILSGILLGASVKYWKDAVNKLLKILNITEEEKIVLVKKVIEKIEQPKEVQPEEPKIEEATEIAR